VQASKVHVFGLLNNGSYVGLMEKLYLKDDKYYLTMTCKSHSGGSLFRIRADSFIDKLSARDI